MKIVIGTRTSKWACAAAARVAGLIQERFPEVEVEIRTLQSPGDLSEEDLARIGGTTSFVDALSIEAARGSIDVAIHTVKDISWPSDTAKLPEGSWSNEGFTSSGDLVIAALTPRNDPRDALVLKEGQTLEDLLQQHSIRIGTSSRLRAAALRALYPGHEFDIVPVRGIIDARIERLDKGEFDALLLSMDGLTAVGQQHRATRIFDIEEMPPALGQAFGAAECRRDNTAVREILNAVCNPDATRVLRAEWAAMRTLGASCMTPLGGICTTAPDGTLGMVARMMGPEGECITARVERFTGVTPEILGTQIAEDLIELGARQLEARWDSFEHGLSQDAC